MIPTKSLLKIAFKAFDIQDRELYEKFLSEEKGRGCEFSFANLYLWGRQSYAVLHDNMLLFSCFDNQLVYPYPLGKNNKKEAINAIIEDSRLCGIPCKITGLSKEAKQTVESLFPGKFSFNYNEGTFDYVYSIDDLAQLQGKKYHKKRNHLNRFKEEFPRYSVKLIDENNIERAICFVRDWYVTRLYDDPKSDFHIEQAALEKALMEYSRLGLEGLILENENDIFAITLGSRMSADTMDVHFEKARTDINGTYTAINYEFANYIREKYPEVRFLDREEDMGIEGLRKAKKSYHPHHMVEKYTAILLEDQYDN